MGLRELKNQLLSEIKRREEISSNVQEIETSEIDETELEKDESESLELIHKIELAEDVDREIEPSVSDEIQSEKGKSEVSGVDSKINFAKDVKQILRNIAFHMETESSSRQSDLRSTASPSKDTPNLFNKLYVKVFSEESTIKEYKRYEIPIQLKSKFGVIKRWQVRDKAKGGILNRQSAMKENIYSTNALYKTFISKSK